MPTAAPAAKTVDLIKKIGDASGGGMKHCPVKITASTSAETAAALGQKNLSAVSSWQTVDMK